MSERPQILATPVMVVCGITILIVITLLIPIKPPYVTDRDHVNKLKRQANLRSVVGYVIAFSDETDNGFFPTPDQYGELLLKQMKIMPEPLFGHEDTQDDIWICPIPWPDRRVPVDITQEELARIPLLHERVDLNPDGTSVAFWDGHVELLSNEEFEQLIDVEQSVCLACEFSLPNLMNRRGP